jgi:hypothetical protein
MFEQRAVWPIIAPCSLSATPTIRIGAWPAITSMMSSKALRCFALLAQFLTVSTDVLINKDAHDTSLSSDEEQDELHVYPCLGAPIANC